MAVQLLTAEGPAAPAAARHLACSESACGNKDIVLICVVVRIRTLLRSLADV